MRSDEFNAGYTQALKEINTPAKVVTPQWDASCCPRCERDFHAFEPCEDGYYKRAYSLERCPYCGQKLGW